MSQHAGISTIDWKGFPEAVAVVLAGLVALAALSQRQIVRPSCPAVARAAVERPEPPARRAVEDDPVLRDTRLHD